MNQGTELSWLAAKKAEGGKPGEWVFGFCEDSIKNKG